jgi:hypothetical protein
LILLWFLNKVNGFNALATSQGGAVSDPLANSPFFRLHYSPFLTGDFPRLKSRGLIEAALAKRFLT